MKVLIISNSRCGSTNLMKSISSFYDIPYVFEPFLFETPFNLDNPIVLKTLINQHNMDFYRDFIPKFDKVVLLTRKNTIEMTESLVSLSNRLKDEGYDYSKELHKKTYEFEYEGDVTQTEMYLKVCQRKNNIIRLSNEFNIPIDFYEDVFIKNKCLNDSTIGLDLSYLDNSLKLRKK